MKTNRLILFTWLTFSLGSLGVPAQTSDSKIVYTNGDLYLQAMSGGSPVGSPTRLTFTQASEYNPRLSPAGDKILFQASGRKADTGTFIMLPQPEGPSNPRIKLLGVGSAAWAPDGSRIAYGDNGIWVTEPNNTAPRVQLTTFGTRPAWSPDGSKIAFISDAFTGDSDLCWVDVQINADGSVTVLSGPSLLLSFPGSELDLVWLPSSKLAFAHYVDAKYSWEIYVFDPFTGLLTRLTTSLKQDFEPAWSPDGAMMVFYSARTPAGLYVMNPATGMLLSPTPISFGGRQPSWSW